MVVVCCAPSTGAMSFFDAGPAPSPSRSQPSSLTPAGTIVPPSPTPPPPALSRRAAPRRFHHDLLLLGDY